MKYIPQLDSLRFWSFFLVFLFHFNSTLFPIGWIGVNIFFTISGFLISSILIKSLGKTNYFLSFYWKRTLRIFPIYYLYILGVLIYCLIFQIPGNFLPFPFYLQNVFIFLDFPPITVHTWTLAIEEQFYLIFPFLIYFLNKININRIKIYFLIILLSFLYRFLMLQIFPGNYYFHTMLFSQMDSLIYGALLAELYLNKKSLPNFILPTGILIFLSLWASSYSYTNDIIESFHVFNTPEKYITNYLGQFIYPIIGIISVGLIDMYVNGRLSFIFDNRVFRSLGKISYGLYLYHFLGLKLSQALLDTFQMDLSFWYLTLQFPLSLGITLVIAIVSWKIIEKPMLNHKNWIKSE